MVVCETSIANHACEPEAAAGDWISYACGCRFENGICLLLGHSNSMNYFRALTRSPSENDAMSSGELQLISATEGNWTDGRPETSAVALPSSVSKSLAIESSLGPRTHKRGCTPDGPTAVQGA